MIRRLVLLSVTVVSSTVQIKLASSTAVKRRGILWASVLGSIIPEIEVVVTWEPRTVVLNTTALVPAVILHCPISRYPSILNFHLLVRLLGIARVIISVCTWVLLNLDHRIRRRR